MSSQLAPADVVRLAIFHADQCEVVDQTLAQVLERVLVGREAPADARTGARCPSWAGYCQNACVFGTRAGVEL